MLALRPVLHLHVAGLGSGLVSAFGVERGTAQLGDAGDLVDADGDLEHQGYDFGLMICETG